MKKTFTVLAALALFILSSTINAAPCDYKIRLSNVAASDAYENFDYEYNEDNLLVRSVSLIEGSTYIMDSLFYDEANQLTQVKLFQLISDVWQWVAYVIYSYDESGNKLTRENYNDFGSGFVQGGIYFYYYDENNHMTNWDLYMSDKLVQQCSFTYNEDGLVIEEIGLASGFGGTQMENSWRIVTEYNDHNYCSRETQYFWSGYWDLYSYDEYTYDETGNCIKRDRYAASVVTDRHEYTYSEDYSIEEIVFPENPEEDYPEIHQMKTRLVSDKWSTENDQGNLQYVCDYIFNYTDIIPSTSPSISVTPDALSLTLYGLKEENVGSIFISNNGGADGIISATIENDANNVFSFVNENNATILTGEEYELQVAFNVREAQNEVYEAVVVISTNDPEHPTFEIHLTGTLIVAIDEMTTAAKMYPNPVADILNIECPDIITVELFDVNGRKVAAYNSINGDDALINVAGLKSGIYSTMIVDINGRKTFSKIIKQ